MLPKLLPALNSNTVTLRINKAAFTLGAWGLLILLASLVNQFFIPPSLEAVYALWSVVTLLGIAAQAICLARGLGSNFAVWMVVMVVGWLFTHSGFYADIPGVWLILLGVGYVATAFQVHMRFMWLAGLHRLPGSHALHVACRAPLRYGGVDGACRAQYREPPAADELCLAGVRAGRRTPAGNRGASRLVQAEAARR
jgi:hypothetical protein